MYVFFMKRILKLLFLEVEEEENSSKEVGLKSSLTINGANSFKRNRPQTDIKKKVKINSLMYS